MIKRLFIVTAALLLTSSLAVAGELAIPASGTGEGADHSQWQTELTLHNAGAEALPLTLSYYDATGKAGEFEISINPKSTLSIADVVKNRFGKESSTGAIVIAADDVPLRKLGVTSRTFNAGPNGEFGQDIPALPLSAALVSGDTGVLPAQSSAAAARFNFGAFALDATTIEWQLVRKDGTVAATESKSYAAGVQVQYNNGVINLFGSTAQDNDVVYARVQGRALVYGSIITQQTGDPTYVPPSRVRENLPVEFIGVDLHEDGTIDVMDADHDGILDRSITVYTERFPNYFRIVAADPEGQPITLSIVDQADDVRFIDNKGTIMWYPMADRTGTTGTLKVRASDGIDTTDLVITANFVH